MRTTSTVSAELLSAATAIRRGATGFAARARAEHPGALSINQTAVMGLLYKRGAMTPSEVAHRLQMQPQGLTRTFATLEEQKLLRRVPDPTDGRQSLLSITAMGRRVLGDEMRPRDEWVARVLAGMVTPAERELLVVAAGLLERLSDVDLDVARREA